MTQTWRQVLRPQTQVSPVHWSPVVSPSARPRSGLGGEWGGDGMDLGTGQWEVLAGVEVPQ